VIEALALGPNVLISLIHSQVLNRPSGLPDNLTLAYAHF